jgi:hypothetical protein
MPLLHKRAQLSASTPIPRYRQYHRPIVSLLHFCFYVFDRVGMRKGISFQQDTMAQPLQHENTRSSFQKHPHGIQIAPVRNSEVRSMSVAR